MSDETGVQVRCGEPASGLAFVQMLHKRGIVGENVKRVVIDAHCDDCLVLYVQVLVGDKLTKHVMDALVINEDLLPRATETANV